MVHLKFIWWREGTKAKDFKGENDAMRQYIQTILPKYNIHLKLINMHRWWFWGKA